MFFFMVIFHAQKILNQAMVPFEPLCQPSLPQNTLLVIPKQHKLSMGQKFVSCIPAWYSHVYSHIWLGTRQVEVERRSKCIGQVTSCVPIGGTLPFLTRKGNPEHLGIGRIWVCNWMETWVFIWIISNHLAVRET